MEKFVLVPLAQGTEEMEAVISTDLLRRAKINVKVAGENELVTCSRGLKIVPDMLIENIDPETEFDGIVLPGGAEGTRRLTELDHLEKIIRTHFLKGKLIAAICAAPTILTYHKIIPPGCSITSHPSVAGQFSGYAYREDNLVLFQNILTSRGAGTAIEFALKVIEILVGKSTAEKVAGDIIYNNNR